MHLEFVSNEMDREQVSKKDIAGLIKRMLYKCKEGSRTEVFKGCFIEKKSFQRLLKELEGKGKEIFVLDSKGESLRKIEDNKLKDCVFVIGDHEGLPVKEVKRFEKISIGPETYFASQCFVVVNNELDIRNS